MEFKRSILSVALAGATVFSGTAVAGTSVNAGVLSQYLFRGLPQSDGAAVFGGIDYAAESGFYAGAWAATINFGGSPNLGDGGSTGSELDLYAGVGGEIGTMGYDIGAIYYYYAEEDEFDQPDPSYNTIELYGSLSAGMFSLGFYFAPDTYFGAVNADGSEADGAYGVSLGFSAPMTEAATFDVSIQSNGGEGNEAFAGGDSYIDYSVGINAEGDSGLFMGLSFVGTDIDVGPFSDDPKVIVSGGYAFDI